MPGALLKRFLPRGFYGRAALILLVPVTCILLIASYAVIQRHYEGMTRQMTGIFALTVAHVQAAVDAAPDSASADQQAARLGQAFDLQARVHPVGATPAQGTRASLLSLSDRMMLEQLHRGIPGVQVVTLDGNIVTLWLDSRHGPLSLRFRSNTVSPRNPHQLLVVVLLGGVLMSAIGFVFLKNQVRPILRLAAAAEAFGLGKTVPYRPSGAREVRAAGLAFVEMRDRIERHIEQRTLLLSGVSHDLRTPLTRMRLALSMMQDEGEAAAMLDDVAQMEALIDRLLDFARAEAGEAPVITDLTALVRQSLDRAARGGGQAVALAGAPGPLMVSLRPHLFGRALDNLIDNALRYGTRVEVRILSGVAGGTGVAGGAGAAGAETGTTPPAGGQHIVVEVEDNGPGIPGDLRDAAMRPFVRLDKARSAARGATGQKMGGVGLGLAIAGDAMRSHGGHLQLADGSQPGLGGLLARLVLPVKGA